METRIRISSIASLAVLALAGCSSSSDNEPRGSGGSTGSGGTTATGGSSATGGTPGTGGSSATGGITGTGGSSATGGTPGTGGSSATGGRTGTGGTTGTGGSSATGGATPGTGGITGTGGKTGTGGASSGTGGETGTGGRTGTGGSTSTDGGVRDASPEIGGDTGGTGFAPCPSNGDPCKILPLGDSITWGINYGGGYRIKLFIHTVTDSKNITFVGYDTANPPSQSVLSGLGSASSKWVGKHEGHSGWTIQQDDDLVTGKSTATNDSVSYTGKKVVADFGPHIVLIHLGTNDMYQSPTGADTRLGTLIDHVVADAPNALIVVSSIIPFPSGASAVSTFNKAVPGVVKQRADAGKHVLYVDMFSALTTADLGSDQVHPNEGGYEKMAVVWYGAIKAYLH
jgi:lysophospholipase L1-like esterase